MTERRTLRDGGIYSLALTPYQYIARRIPESSVYHAAGVAWVLVPEWQDNALIGGPVLYVDEQGRIGRSDGLTQLTTDNLDFTGRYADATNS